MRELEQIVTSTQKKVFIKWLIEQHVLDNRETIWLLNYLRSNERLLNIVHFVEAIGQRQRSIVISCNSRRDSDFEYIKSAVRTTDPEKAFHDLRLNQDDPVYIKINMESVQPSAEYFAVLEDSQDSSPLSIHETYGKAAESATNAAERAYAETIIYEQINHALDIGDRDKFIELSNLWKTLKGQNR